MQENSAGLGRNCRRRPWQVPRPTGTGPEGNDLPEADAALAPDWSCQEPENGCCGVTGMRWKAPTGASACLRVDVLSAGRRTPWRMSPPWWMSPPGSGTAVGKPVLHARRVNPRPADSGPPRCRREHAPPGAAEVPERQGPCQGWLRTSACRSSPRRSAGPAVRDLPVPEAGAGG